MTTQPPSPEAVEAAMKHAKDERLNDDEYDAISGYYDHWEERRSCGSMRILAAEVERLLADLEASEQRFIETASLAVGYEKQIAELRADLAAQQKLISQWLNRRASVEDVLYSVAAGKRGPLTPDECRELAVKLGVPEK